LKSNINPSDWRREVKRVSKNLTLDIPELPEFLISNSNCSDGSLANSKNILEILNNSKEDITCKLSCMHNFLNKATKNNSNFIMLTNCSDQIDNELNNIKKFEKIISSKGNLKGKIQKANETIQENKIKQDNFSDYEQMVLEKQREYDVLIDRLQRVKDKEKEIETNSDPKKERNIRERIIELKVKIFYFIFILFFRKVLEKWKRIILCS
jgi:hypothetical protein